MRQQSTSHTEQSTIGDRCASIGCRRQSTCQWRHTGTAGGGGMIVPEAQSYVLYLN